MESGEDSVSLFRGLGDQLDELKARYVGAAEELQRREERLAMQIQLLEKEKQAMTARDIKENDIVELNVCGDVIAARRRTLCQVEGSLLEAMFSGRWEESQTRDKNGRVFLELDPVCFRALLNALIHDSLHPGSESWRRPTVPPEHGQNLEDMMEYLGLWNVVPVGQQLKLRLGANNSGEADIMQHGTSARKTDDSGWACVLSTEPLPSTQCEWGVAVRGVGREWFFIGVMWWEEGQTDPESTSFKDPRSYGWGEPKECMVGGKNLPCKDYVGLQGGDMVRMRMNAVAHILTMIVIRGRQRLSYSLDLPPDAVLRNWHVHFTLSYQNDCVELLSPEDFAAL